MHRHRRPFRDLSFCFVITTALILIRGPAALGADDLSYSNCSSTINCGVLRNAGYPFWGLNRASYCGLPNFQVTCLDDATPLLNISHQSYRVLRFNDTTNIMTVAREDYWNTICPTSLVNTTQGISSFTYTSDTVASNLTLYYGCTTGISKAMVMISTMTTEFDCTINDTYIIGYVITKKISDITAGDITPILNYLGNCDTIVVLPASRSAIQKIESDQSNTTAMSAIDEGFGLQWTVSEQCIGCSTSGGQCGRDNSTGDFACYCQDKSYPSTCSGSNRRFISSPAGVLVIIGVSVSTIAIIFIVKVKIGIFSWKVLFFESEKDRDIEKLMGIHGSLIPRRYRYIDLKKMTNSFSEKLGQGGFGAVYRGEIRDVCLVAVKILTELKSSPEEFINEVMSISRTSHVNVITLLGFCYEGKTRALVFEYMPNGSLDKLIYSGRALDMTSSLGWKVLYQITIGIARGLEYLHRGCNTRILHFDIKPQNILLDQDFIPKISDFGLAKLCHGQESAVSTPGMRGTVGFIAPELVFRSLGRVSPKSDVYSYGMLVLEMIGVRDSDMKVSNSSEMYFPEWIYRNLEPGKDLKLPMNVTEEEEVLVRKMIIVSLWCVQTSPFDRPPIAKVIEMLEGSFESLQMPPKPILYSRTPPLSQHWEMTTSNTNGSHDEERIQENLEESSNIWQSGNER